MSEKTYSIYRENFNGKKIRKELIGNLPMRVIKKIHKVLSVNESAGEVIVSAAKTYNVPYNDPFSKTGKSYKEISNV